MKTLIYLANTLLLTTFLSAQNTGINTAAPTERLDITEGNMRIRTINSTQGTPADRTVVADKNGVLKTVLTSDPELNTLLHAKLESDQTIFNGVSTLLFAAPTVTSELYAYDPKTGVFTFTQSGNYLVILQVGMTKMDYKQHVLLGIRPEPDGPYIGRGSFFTHKNSSGADKIADVKLYKTVLTISGGQKIRFVASASYNNPTIALKDESDSTGTGNVSHVTIQKI